MINNMDNSINMVKSNHAESTSVNKPRNIYKLEIVWRNVAMFILLHLVAVYGLYISVFYVSINMIYYLTAVNFLCGLGILAGAHRLWAHRSYKARLPLKIFLAILQTASIQNDIYEWARDHRLHHKHSDTDADPHNSRRGFFFSHVGWLLCRKHPEVKEKGKTVDMSDLWADPLIRFQRRFYIPLTIIIRLTLFTYLPMRWFNVSYLDGLAINMMGLVVNLNHTWLVNSAAHIYGYKPYDNTINPKENRAVVYMALGEGYHNYHHTFPYDYSASEYGWADGFNPATAFIDLCYKLGLAYDLKKPTKETIEQR
ncbi:unnamed protein product, partial [Medioppia subpectinata]